MKKTQPEGSEQQGGWPSKKMMAGRSRKVFSLDFLFIEQLRPTKAAKPVSYRCLSASRSPADARRYINRPCTKIPPFETFRYSPFRLFGQDVILLKKSLSA